MLKSTLEIDKMRKRRKEISMNQTELGEIVGVSFHQISKYELGINRIPCSKIYLIARALGTSCQYFFNFDTDEKTDLIKTQYLDQHSQETNTKNILSVINLFKNNIDNHFTENIQVLSNEILSYLEKIKGK